jgi:hypothetical protein
MDETESCGSSVEESTLPVTPTQTRDKGRNKPTAGDDELNVPAVLPPDDRVLAQVANVCDTNLIPRFQNHPADVRPPEALVRIVGVKVGVGVTVVCTVSARPPLDRPLNGTGSSHGQEVLER